MERPVLCLRRALVAIVLTFLGVAFAVVPPAGAETADDKRTEAKQIAEKLAELQEEQMELGAKYERASYERHLADQKAEEAQAQVDETAAELELRRQDLRRFAITAYQGGTDTPTAAALLSSEATSGTVKRFYLETSTGDRADLIDALKSAERAAEADVERLNEAREEAESYAAEIERARDAASEATAQQDALNDNVQGELAELVAQEAAALATTTTQAPTIAAANSAPSGSVAGPSAPAARPRPAPAPAPAPSPAPPPSGSKASGAISAALSKVGSPYVWGAAGPNAFDCSGLVMWAYGRVGVSLPHYSGAQYNVTTRISASQLQPGDLVFWGPGGSDHVAIYMGGNQLVHAFGSGGGVGTTHLNGWWKPPSGYGRIHY